MFMHNVIVSMVIMADFNLKVGQMRTFDNRWKISPTETKHC